MAGRGDRGVRRAPGFRARLDTFCSRRAAVILAVMIVGWAVVFSSLALLKYRHYLYSDIDCAMFVQIVDGILRGSLANSIRGMNWLGDHSSLILFLVAPIYAVFRHPLTLPILQCVTLALGALPVFTLARRELGQGVLPLGFALLYLLFPALAYTALYEFHPEVLGTTTLLAAFACYRAGRLGWMLLFVVVSLLTKEDMALPVAALAVVVVLDRRPRWGVTAATLGGLALASLALSFGYLKPTFSAGEVDYGRMYLSWGSSPSDVAVNIARHPLRALLALVWTPGDPLDSAIKVQYYLHLLFPLLFLPLASPRTLLIALPTLATHFLSWRPVQHTIYTQYTATVTPFVLAAAVIGLRNVLSWSDRPPRTARRGEDGPRPTRTAALLVLVGMLVASLAANWMFGALTGHGRWQAVVAEEPMTPKPMDRALTRYRDRLMMELGPGDSVVAGFEFLMRLADRPHTRSFHNVAGGLHTFSTKPYPIPEGVRAMIADVGHPRIRPYALAGTGARLRETLRRNQLGLVEASGDILLFVRGVPDSVEIWREGELPVPHPARVVFDRQIAFLGHELVSNSVAPGGLLTLRTHWRRVAPTDSLYLLELAAYDTSNPNSVRMAFSTMRYLGYMLHPVADWPDTTMARETYRMVIPEDAAPGRYMLGMRVGRRWGSSQRRSETDDPQVNAQNMVVELGPFTVVPREP